MTMPAGGSSLRELMTSLAACSIMASADMNARLCCLLGALAPAAATPTALQGDDQGPPARWQLTLRSRTAAADGKGHFDVALKKAEWDPRQTAVIVCDMWDS